MDRALAEFGYSKATLKAKADRCAYFEDLRNNPERAVVKDLLYRRGDRYTLEEVRLVVEHLALSTVEDCVLQNADDFPPPVVANAVRAERHFTRAMNRINREMNDGAE